MHVTGRIVSKETGAGVPYASIMLQNANSQYLGVGVAADQYGYFSIDSNSLAAGTYLHVSSSGFFPTSIPFENYTTKDVFQLSTQAPILPEVVVTAGSGSATGKKLLWGAAALLGLYLVFEKEIKKSF